MLLMTLAVVACVLAAGADVTPVKDFSLEKVRDVSQGCWFLWLVVEVTALPHLDVREMVQCWHGNQRSVVRQQQDGDEDGDRQMFTDG